MAHFVRRFCQHLCGPGRELPKTFGLTCPVGVRPCPRRDLRSMVSEAGEVCCEGQGCVLGDDGVHPVGQQLGDFLTGRTFESADAPIQGIVRPLGPKPTTMGTCTPARMVASHPTSNPAFGHHTD